MPPIQLQIYSGASGILQTIYGWFPVTGYRTTSSGLAFELDGVNDVPPNALDARIIGRAAEILSSTAAWSCYLDFFSSRNEIFALSNEWSQFCGCRQSRDRSA